MIVNGYEISGNVATVGREYHVTDASGETVCITDHQRKAVEWANIAQTGDVAQVADNAEPVAEAITESVDETIRLAEAVEDTEEDTNDAAETTAEDYDTTQQ